MSVREMTAYDKIIDIKDINDLLPRISDILDKKEIKKTDLSKNTKIPRSTIYEFLYKKSDDLEKIQKILSYLGIVISIKLAYK